MKNILFILLIISGMGAYAQKSSTSLGLRGGSVSGLSMKFLDDDLSALEFIIGYQHDGFRFVSLIQKYTPVAVHRIANFYFVSGFGAHTGLSQFDEYKQQVVDGIEYYSYRRKNSPVIGADMSFGFEYRFEAVPIDISLDYKPYFELFGQKPFRTDFWDIGFTLRYAFNR